MNSKIIRTSMCALLLGATLIATEASANWSNNPYGWGTRDTNKQARICQNAINRYNSLLNIYNQRHKYSRNESIRRAAREDLQDARRQAERACN